MLNLRRAASAFVPVLLAGIVCGCSCAGNAPAESEAAATAPVPVETEATAPYMDPGDPSYGYPSEDDLRDEYGNLFKDIYKGTDSNLGQVNYSGRHYREMAEGKRETIASSDIYTTSDSELLPDMGLNFIDLKTTGERFVLCGYELVPVGEFSYKVDKENTPRIRDNTTGYLVGLYNSREEYDTAMSQYALAGSIIRRETEPEEGTIILNGRVTDLPHFYMQDGEVWLPVADIWTELGFKWEERSDCLILMDVFGRELYFDTAKGIKRHENLRREDTPAGHYLIRSNYNGAGEIEGWEDNVPCAVKEDDGTWYARGDILMRLAGMSGKYDEDCRYVIIESDPKDIPQKFFIWNEDHFHYDPAD